METRKLQRGSGTTLVTLPPDQLERLGLAAGDKVGLEASDGSIEIFPVEVNRRAAAEEGEGS